MILHGFVEEPQTHLSTIKKADLIVVLNQGKITETGTHKELLKKDSAYKKLVQLQTF